MSEILATLPAGRAGVGAGMGAGMGAVGAGVGAGVPTEAIYRHQIEAAAPNLRRLAEYCAVLPANLGRS